MIIPLDRMLSYGGNKYVFTKACMNAVDKIGNMRNYPETDKNWKVVPNILDLMLKEDIKFQLGEMEEE